MPTFKLPFSRNNYSDMVKGNISEFDFIQGIMRADKDTIQKVCFELLEYYMGEGSPSIDDFEISEAFFDKNHKNATVSVEYIVHVYFGCDDQNNSSERSDDISVGLDISSRVATLTIPDKHIRSTSEEF